MNHVAREFRDFVIFVADTFLVNAIKAVSWGVALALAYKAFVWVSAI